MIGWLALTAHLFFHAPGPSTLAQLESDVSAGRVDTVRIIDHQPKAAMPRHGFNTVQVEWRVGLFTHSTEVVEANPKHAGRRAARNDGVTGLIAVPLEDHLRELHPGLDVTHEPLRAGWSTTLLGHTTTGGAGVVLIATLTVATVTVLIAGPGPWRATRWAWLWLLFTPLTPWSQPSSWASADPSACSLPRTHDDVSQAVGPSSSPC